jgi:hypothetical protein
VQYSFPGWWRGQVVLALKIKDFEFEYPPGVDVMITIFCDFRQFSAKKSAFFSKTDQFF